MIIGSKGLVDSPPRLDGDRWAAGRGAWGRDRSACRGANVSWHRRQYHVYPDHRQVHAGAPYPSVSVPPALAHGRRQFHWRLRRKRRQRCSAACCWPAACEVAWLPAALAVISWAAGGGQKRRQQQRRQKPRLVAARHQRTPMMAPLSWDPNDDGDDDDGARHCSDRIRRRSSLPRKGKEKGEKGGGVSKFD